ncbi:c2h2 zinc finger cgi-62-related [Holotrichia oblita]|uniref:C2h2 zinc finger cgi-62-related n=1 Tax=Holotrichia oblita TaxID=644536 RepID=A0ACB9TMI0_HOLOL|nr:c2h2 zinc finger cgi-62-related [Holotrichia oblita]
MENFSNAELTDMHFVYGPSNGNGRQAGRLYAELYPGRRVPHHTIFARLHQRLRENGTFKKQTADCGRPREVRTVQLEEEVLELIAESPMGRYLKCTKCVLYFIGCLSHVMR